MRKVSLVLGAVFVGAISIWALGAATPGAGIISSGGGGASLPPQTGNSGKFLTTDGTDASWGTVTTGLNAPNTSFELIDEFIGAPVASARTGAIGFMPNTSGTSASVAAGTATDSALGVWDLATGTDTSGRSNIQPVAIGSVCLGAGEVIFEARIKIDALSDGTNTYTAWAGLIDAGNGEGTDAICFRYIHSANSGKWLAYTRSNSTETTIDTGTAFAANTWYRLRAVVNADASNVAFSVNGGTAVNITTNIPKATARATGPGLTILKSAGATSRTMTVDYYYLKFTPTGGR